MPRYEEQETRDTLARIFPRTRFEIQSTLLGAETNRNASSVLQHCVRHIVDQMRGVTAEEKPRLAAIPSLIHVCSDKEYVDVYRRNINLMYYGHEERPNQPIEYQRMADLLTTTIFDIKKKTIDSENGMTLFVDKNVAGIYLKAPKSPAPQDTSAFMNALVEETLHAATPLHDILHILEHAPLPKEITATPKSRKAYLELLTLHYRNNFFAFYAPEYLLSEEKEMYDATKKAFTPLAHPLSRMYFLGNDVFSR